MKRVILLGLVVLATGCATAKIPEVTGEMDWRHGEVVGEIAGLPYVFEGDEITLDLYTDTNGRMRGTHKLHIEDDEVKYKLKYRF